MTADRRKLGTGGNASGHPTASVDRADARDRHDVIVLAQLSESAEHLGAHGLDILRSKATDAAKNRTARMPEEGLEPPTRGL